MIAKAKGARVAIFALTLWLAPAFAPSALASVRVFGVWNCRQNPQIQVDLWAKPLAGASVEIYRGFGPLGQAPGGKPILVLTSDEKGQVVLPKLPYGRYYILGRAKPDREDYLYLEISESGRDWPDLVLNVDAVPGSAEYVLSRARTVRPANVVSAFRGVVKGFDGTPVPNATIDVFVKQLGIDQKATHLHTGSLGEFSADFPEGEYAISISGVWARVAVGTILAVDISREATNDMLKITLHPGMTE
jgi:hypothetical protein